MPASESSAFDKLGRYNTERESIKCLAPKIDRLIADLNRLQRMAEFQGQMGGETQEPEVLLGPALRPISWKSHLGGRQ